MKKFLHSFWVLACILCIVYYTPQQAHSYASGAPNGKTGSPGDNGSTCYSCHSGPSASGSDEIDISFDNGNMEVTNNGVYPLSVSLYSDDQSVFGFQMVAEDDNGNSIGEFIITNFITTQVSGNYLTHTSNGTFFDEDAVWESSWFAPIGFEGTVTFYVAGLISNQSGTNLGDKVMTTNYTIQVISDVVLIPGCTDPLAINFNPFATDDDASCEYETEEGVYIMGQVLDVFTCDGLLYDSGGAEEDFILGESGVIHIYPEDEGGSVQLFFEEFDLGFFGNMTIYDGDEEGISPILVGALGSDLLFQTYAATEGNESGCLTIEFNHNPVETSSGWKALISCIPSSDANCTNLEAINYNPNAVIDDGSCEFNISSSEVITTCGGTLYDSGGLTGEYLDNENYTISIYPEVDSEFVSLYFASFQLETCCDYVTIYDGESINAPILVPASNGTSLNSQTYYASSTNESGALTLTFTTDGSVTEPGWAAEIGCTTYGPCFGFDVDVIASFESVENASDATATLNITLGNEPFEYYWSTGETTESITDLTSGNYSVSIIDSEGCSTESSFDVIVDPEEYIIGDLFNLNTCNGILYDSGGPDGFYEPGEDLFIRICPDEVGFASQIEFTEFDLGFDGTIVIYDGMGTANPILTTGTGASLLGQTIVASEGNATGCLTITFVSTLWWGGSSGWEAYISCHDYIIMGCMDTEANNYDNTAEDDDGSCYYSPGCTDNTYVEYHTQGFEADFDDGSCSIPFVDDCTNVDALNYNPEATLNLAQDPCVFQLEDWICGMHYKDERDGNSYGSVLIGTNCWMTENLNYAYSETNTTPIPNGVATQFDEGFIYTGLDEYNSDINGRYYTWAAAGASVPFSWHLPRAQEFESLFENFTATDHQMNESSGFNSQMSGGVILPTGELEFMNQGNTTWLWSSTEEDEGSANALTMISTSMNPTYDVIPKEFALSIRAVFGFPQGTILGCTDPDYIEYNEQANTDDGSCIIVVINGCMDETALNFSEIATVNDDSCIPNIEGCMDAIYSEYNDEATVDNGSCEIIAIFGCTDTDAQNYDETANVDDDSCIDHILGCTDNNFSEYNAEATMDDGSCNITAILGCMDESAFNYNSAANVDDDSCLPYLEGCTDESFIEFNGMANVDDGTCSILVIYGCTIDYALNYDENANTDDGSCQVEGCTNELFVEFDINANIDNGSCTIFAIWGCTNDLYLEFFPPANMDDNSCNNLIVEGCMDPVYIEYSADANVANGSCMNLALLGCTNENYLEYNSEAVVDNNTCATPVVLGCMNNTYLEYSALANVDDASCNTIKIEGCTDVLFIEYNPQANSDDGSCTFITLYGCMEENYTEYNPNVNVDNGTCNTEVVEGCIDILAFNYNEDANTDDGSCVPVVSGCMDPNFVEYNSFANTEDLSMCITPVVLGCIDIEAINYNPLANTDDGSCYMYLVELFSEGMANGGMQFTAAILGLGSQYELFWTFDNGTTSSEPNPLVFFLENGTYAVTLVVNTGDIEVSTTIYVDILNAPGIGLDELSTSKTIVSVTYFDLIGRVVYKENLENNQVYIKKMIYDDGSNSYMKLVASGK